ncbi:hypothetical protein N7532_009517 [Penicillium argentinense]|uniref:DUF1907 domain-containing protein n=1 Tax=Penicillium argentinense TaxID=1131581 RepID=A0A9W9EZH3_9EURO|nr:uncharacterized protein N7532_009517 [Penicillium argentinense]KAJ5090833.1 hypothetical protein N7532_009517 [Penicillium argentinense]
MIITAHPRGPPELSELATILQKQLSSNFASATVVVVEQCPDLQQPPFNLAAPGLSGYPWIADIGGQSNLFPTPNYKAQYSLLQLARNLQNSPSGGAVIGAGAAPFQDIGRNAELAPNLAWEGYGDEDFEGDSLKVNNLTRVVLADRGGVPSCQRTTSTNCALMMNLYGSSGRPGPVLKVTARGRTGDMNFTNCIRFGLRDTYGDSRPISMGGVFLLKKGKAKFHVMPDFPTADELPFRDREQLEKEWLTYHVFDAPVVCLSVFHSADPEGLGLRMEHTHCFETNGNIKGGHYHYDIQDGDEEVEYEAYLHPASTLYRIDRPRS